MNTAKIYHDSQDNECSIHQMVKREPGWAANRIQAGEKAIEKVKRLENVIKRLQEDNTALRSIVQSMDRLMVEKGMEDLRVEIDSRLLEEEE